MADFIGQAGDSAMWQLARIWFERMEEMMRIPGKRYVWDELSNYDKAAHWYCVQRILQERDLMTRALESEAECHALK